MSLEANLELNNQLLTQQNTLLTELIRAMARQHTGPTDSTPQAYVEKVPVSGTVGESTPGENEITLEDLKFEDVVALAGMFPESKSFTQDDYKAALDYRNATGNDRNEQTDALLMALSGVTRAKELLNTVLLQLCRTMLGYWDELPGITERREFVERWLDTKPPERKDVKPANPTAKGKKGPIYWKNSAGAFGIANDETELTAVRMAKDGDSVIEIHKVEYLQLKEAAEKADDTKDSDVGQPDFAAQRKQATDLIMQLVKGGYRAEAVAILDKQGAKKLGEVADEQLGDVIAQAEAALEG